MDGINPSLNPMSNTFHTAAVKNVSQQMGILKTSKEIKDNDDDATNLRDSVELSGRAKEATAQEHLQAASHSGALSEHAKGVKRKDENKTTGLGVFVGREETEAQGALSEEEEIQAKALADEISKVMDKDIVQIKDGIPPEIYEAAKRIVEGQINHRAEPAQTLTDIKAVPETADVELKPAEFHPILDIHDTNNQPMPMIEEEVPA